MGLGLMYDRDLPIPVRSKPHGLYDGRHIGSGAYCVGFRYTEPQSFIFSRDMMCACAPFLSQADAFGCEE